MSNDSKKIVSDFIQSVKLKKRTDIGKMISFPLDREYPLPEVRRLGDFIRRYDEIFDSSLTNEIVNSMDSDWREVGWRGIMLRYGDLWLDYDGRILAVNKLSAVETQRRQAMIEQEKGSLYPTLQDFKEPICLLETWKYRVRVDDLGNDNYRYSSWPLDSKMSSKPALVIEKGEVVPEGSGGNHFYKFKQGEYVYECYIIEMPWEDNSPPAILTVYRGGKVILSEDAKMITN
jgi:hypothetical protein